MTGADVIAPRATETPAATTGRAPSGARPTGSLRIGGLITKIILLGLLDAVGVWALTVMAAKHDWTFFVCTALAIAVINIVYLTQRRFIPAKYLLPGTLFLLVFALYPVGYTMYNALTNYGTGNNLSKPQALEQIQRNSIGQASQGQRFKLQVLAKGDAQGPLAFLLTDDSGAAFLGTTDGLQPLTPAQLVPQGSRRTVDGYRALNLGQTQGRAAEIAALKVPSPAGEITNSGFDTAYAKSQGLTYDPATNTILDAAKNITYHENAGYFVDDAGNRLLPGWRAFIGLENFRRLASGNIRGPFLRVFLWTMIFSIGSVLTTFALGLLLAMVFNNERMRGKRLYRLAMVIPYALPSFMTALVWRGMFNQSFGVINHYLGTNWAWLDGKWLPYISILIVNLWLGFPYMFLVCTGALQGIPSDLKEAAVVDGATGWAAFKRITFPLLLIAVAPLLIASFAFNFNNFNIIYLLTEGKPAVPGSDAGRTDIMITYMYKLAFGGGRGADYGFASAVSVLIFVIVAGISAFSFKFTKTFEEIK